MDDMRAMIQDELRQALAGLMPPPVPIAAIPLTAVASVVNLSVVDAPPDNNGSAWGQPLLGMYLLSK